MPDTPKTNHNNIKTSKNKPKNTILPCSKTTHYFSEIFLFFFFNIQFFAFEKLCFAENTIKGVFSAKAQLFKNTVSKTHFFTHVKKTPFSKEKVSFLVFRWNHYF